MKPHYLLQDFLADNDVLKGPMDVLTKCKLENRNYLSQTLLTYVCEEFLKILKNPWTYLMFAMPSILLGIMVSRIEESKTFSVFCRNLKTIILYLCEKPFIENFLGTWFPGSLLFATLTMGIEFGTRMKIVSSN